VLIVINHEHHLVQLIADQNTNHEHLQDQLIADQNTNHEHLQDQLIADHQDLLNLLVVQVLIVTTGEVEEAIVKSDQISSIHLGDFVAICQGENEIREHVGLLPL
jgi:hypothetical protein